MGGSATAPLLLLPALLLLAVADALPPSCSNVTCGEHVVQYPFSLLNESDCGYPGLGLVCEDNATLILPVKSHRYRVFSIDYQAHTVAVSDADIDEYAFGCPRLHMNLTIDTTSNWLQLTPSDSNVTFLYDCKKNASLSTAVEMIWCQGDGGKRWYVLPDGGTGAEAYEYECEEVVVAPVMAVHKEGIVGGAPGAPPPPNGSIGEVVRAGFQLMYNAHSRQCDGCERSGGWCGYRHNQTDAGGMKFTCFCDNGPTADRCAAAAIHARAASSSSPGRRGKGGGTGSDAGEEVPQGVWLGTFAAGDAAAALRFRGSRAELNFLEQLRSSPSLSQRTPPRDALGTSRWPPP